MNTVATFKPVLTKTDFVRRYKEGEFGNAAPTWNDFSDLAQWLLHRGLDHTYRFHLRNRKAGGDTFYNLTYPQLGRHWNGLADRSQWYISMMCPHEHNLIQGEVMQTPNGLYLYYSTLAGKPMRDALLASGREAKGLKAKCMLEYYMNGNSYEWLQALLERYPDHVVEFTTLSKNWGTVPGFNTLYWETRKY